ncbi:MAG: ABC transporter ATP-binding protein [Clostridiales bacterium]|nr:ABC transporter ATP-binding protein [Clostridiales bacterium]
MGERDLRRAGEGARDAGGGSAGSGGGEARGAKGAREIGGLGRGAGRAADGATGVAAGVAGVAAGAGAADGAGGGEAPLLDIRDLRVRFAASGGARGKGGAKGGEARGGGGFVRAVNGVCLSLKAGEALGVVGESGCGKSVTFSSVMRLLKSPPAIVEGEIMFDGADILKLGARAMQRIRGKDITMIFQEPMTSLNPVMKIGPQVMETLVLHERLTPAEAEAKTLEYFRLVEIPDAERRLWSYPHQLSGGLRQRVMIAMALACSPRLLIADEPTTALDVTIQAQILDLLKRTKERAGMGIVMITHDLGVIAEIAQAVAVFYAGCVVEYAETGELFRNPLHPYTAGLLACIPTMRTEAARLSAIDGSIPDPTSLPEGCPFHPRCRRAEAVCRELVPPRRDCGGGHSVMCHFAPA